MSQDNDDFHIIADSLRHFANSLTTLKSDELVKVGNGAIMKDLDANASSCNALAEKLIKERSESLIAYNIGIICSSIMTYLKDLETSKKTLYEKLNGGQEGLAGFQTKFLDEEITRVKGIMDYYCSKYIKK